MPASRAEIHLHRTKFRLSHLGHLISSQSTFKFAIMRELKFQLYIFTLWKEVQQHRGGWPKYSQNPATNFHYPRFINFSQISPLSLSGINYENSQITLSCRILKEIKKIVIARTPRTYFRRRENQ